MKEIYISGEIETVVRADPGLFSLDVLINYDSYMFSRMDAVPLEFS